MPISITVTADSAEELKELIQDLANEAGLNNQAVCNCSSKVTVETYSTAPDLSNLPDAQMNETQAPSDSGFPPSEPSSQTDNYDDEISEDSDDEDDEDEESDDDSTEDEDELSGCNDQPNDEISSHFDEIFGTVGNRPMCGDRVTINGSLFQGGGKVVNTNYSLLYDAAYDYDTKIIRVKADNGKKYNYNKSDLRAKKVIKA